MRNAMEVFIGNRIPMWSSISDFDEMFERAFQNPWSLMTETRPVTRELFQANVEVEETDSAYLLSVDLPGIRKEDIQIDLNERVLTVSGERKREGVSINGKTSERHYGKFQRSFTLPSTIDASKVEANLENGVLTIVLAKSEATKPRSIQIQTGKAGFLSKLLGEKKKEEKDVTSSPASGH